jgi:Kef-type K+ transport system membrane component KefB/nucleotide-binding universal stress UspA family protein
MSLGPNIQFPIDKPVAIFALLMVIVLFVPILSKRLRIPGVVGLILAGIIVGPYGLNLLLRDNSIVLFGTVGLMYIMFIAGLDIDSHDFRKTRNKTIVFGFLTFSIPFLLGTFSSLYILKFDIRASILLGCMFSSHTLLAYPIISRLGITGNSVVSIAAGGTMITDTTALLTLAVIASSVTGDLDSHFWIRISISVILFVGIVLWGFPLVARWLFKVLEGEGISQFIFVLAMLFMAGLLAELSGIEPIIGAFLAGLAFNSLIPKSSPLMNRLKFVGNAIFIPFFLIGVGMLIDMRVFINGTESLVVAATMTIGAIEGKWLAAFLTQKIYGYSRLERGVLFSLSNAHVVATLAAITVGYRIGLLNEYVLNGTIILILITSIISSFIAENSGRKLALLENKVATEENEHGQRIIVSLSNPLNIERLIDLSMLIKNQKNKEPIYALTVVNDDENSGKILSGHQKILNEAITQASAADYIIRPATRIDINPANGINRAIKELYATDIIIGWNPVLSAREMIFGSVIEQVLAGTNRMVLVSHLEQPLNTIKRALIIVLPDAEVEAGFNRWVRMLRNLNNQLGLKYTIYCNEKTKESINNAFESGRYLLHADYRTIVNFEDLGKSFPVLETNELIVFVRSRKGSISHSNITDRMTTQVVKNNINNSFILVYPSQAEFGIQINDDIIGPSIQNGYKNFWQFQNYISKKLKFRK